MNKYDNTLMSLARLTAKESYCKRRQVGAVIVKKGRPIANGYNGTVPGMKNDCEDVKLICNSCGHEVEYGAVGESHCVDGTVIEDSKTKEEVVHAEANAIIFAARHGIMLDSCSIYVTTAPCMNCATLIIGSGIKEVVYEDSYNTENGLKLLIEAGVKVRQYKRVSNEI
jgi:dCMP deaminase